MLLRDINNKYVLYILILSQTTLSSETYLLKQPINKCNKWLGKTTNRKKGGKEGKER